MLKKLNRIFMISMVILFLFIIAACSSQTEDTQQEVVEPNKQDTQEEYLGRNLEIGVLGTPPEIDSEKITFSTVEIEELSIETVEQYDSFFVMKEYLERAADGPYTEVFANSDVLFFFIKTEAYYFPFVDDEISYIDYSKRVHDEEIFSSGYYPAAKEGAAGWQFNILAKDLTEKEHKEIVRGLYYEMFNVIRDLK
ncbi:MULTISPECIES: hypothetical protein [unclassified Planococcus (in: firmicutes)]|uniref:hypothetical protein n=1 Tax=unclassified Planococcus (in: firmicutes) TaxID=2662419 RepID=UPI000C33E1BE|nr:MULTISPECIES: hypothetical protein [unclassified Planococcus (in: firmicutes)]AUD15065.1 hypothetical protein CW734_17040 [Planococcus sp. MB-3u-03]PKG46995.1 hypothetical protein CXF66_04080 [Planococcus sp. Urea-trap-24]PKG87876.1 hypothetical protein CXF91_18130 [Planococcus sp. Urea-3u-39]PKH39103.1 hypothetical protein CXF77_10550 [Planococcus sp. MB-3u-09]